MVLVGITRLEVTVVEEGVHVTEGSSKVEVAVLSHTVVEAVDSGSLLLVGVASGVLSVTVSIEVSLMILIVRLKSSVLDVMTSVGVENSSLLVVSVGTSSDDVTSDVESSLVVVSDNTSLVVSGGMSLVMSVNTSLVVSGGMSVVVSGDTSLVVSGQVSLVISVNMSLVVSGNASLDVSVDTSANEMSSKVGESVSGKEVVISTTVLVVVFKTNGAVEKLEKVAVAVVSTYVDVLVKRPLVVASSVAEDTVWLAVKEKLELALGAGPQIVVT